MEFVYFVCMKYSSLSDLYLMLHRKLGLTWQAVTPTVWGGGHMLTLEPLLINYGSKPHLLF